ncbi:MAG: glycosyltransferase [Planctomycetota bacterium]
MRPIRSATVLIPSWQAMEFLERVLDALAAQQTTLQWDVLVIDSGSHDGTLACLARRRQSFPVPLVVQSIPSAAFDHGDTRNLLAARSTGDLLVFLTQDAIPSSPEWLATLARNFDDPAVGAAYCRNVAREDCWPLTLVASQSDPGYSPARAEVRLPAPDVYARLDSDARRLLYNFNDVASAVRRELWERHPFPRTMMGEDVLMARALLEAGFTIVYDAEATVQHSHDYEPPKQHWRGEVDARFNAEWLDRVAVNVAADVPVLAQRLATDDLARLRALGTPEAEVQALAPRALELRRALVEGLFEGSHAPRRYSRTEARSTGRLSVVLFALEAPECVLAHALELGGELLRRGHRVVVLSLRVGAAGAASASAPASTSASATETASTSGPVRADIGGLYGYELASPDEARAAAHLARFLTDGGFDVGHSFGSGRGLATVAEVAWRVGLPLAVGLHDLAVAREATGRLGLAVAAADLCLVPSVALMRALAASPALARCEPRRIVPCFEGAEPPAGRQRGKLVAKRVRIGVFDAPNTRLGVTATLLDAVRRLPEDGFELRRLPPLERHRARDLADVFADLDVLVAVPEEFGAPARAVQLALAHDTPVVVTAGFGLDELIGRGLTDGEVGQGGLSVAPGDAEALRAALQRFLDEPALARRLCDRADGDAPHLESRGDETRHYVESLGDETRHYVESLGDETKHYVESLGDETRRYVESLGDETKHYVESLGEETRHYVESLGEETRHYVETLRDEAAELEFRYRGMACLKRDRVTPSRVVLDFTGAAAASEGPAEPQGGERLLLRPSARATFPLRGLAPGPIEVELTQFQIGAETGVALGGVMRLGDEVLAHIPPSRGDGVADRHLTETVRVWLRPGAEHITVESGEHYLRIERLRVRACALPEGAPSGVTPMSAQLRIAEALRVHPGGAVDEAALPRVAVIIPTFDGLAVLVECLASLTRARYAPGRMRCIVVDNGSQDGTARHLAEHHKDVQVIALERNLGFAAACNLGARHAADAEVLVFLNNDMRVDARFLVELTSPLVRRECKATVAKRLSWDGATLDGAGVGSTFAGIAVQPGYGAPPGPEHEVPRRTLFPCGGAMAIDAATFTDVGGFDEEYFAYYEDLDLGWRMWVMGHATHYVPSAVAYHHHSHTSRRFPPATVRLVMIRNSLLTCVKNYDDANFARVLPVIVALATRRAWLAAALDAQPLRIESATPTHLAPSGARAEDEAPVAIRALGAADLAALDDLLGRFDHWLEKRRSVQARRALPDQEIFPMFLEPLACVEGDAAYQSLQRALLDLYGVSQLFER